MKEELLIDMAFVDVREGPFFILLYNDRLGSVISLN